MWRSSQPHRKKSKQRSPAERRWHNSFHYLQPHMRWKQCYNLPIHFLFVELHRVSTLLPYSMLKSVCSFSSPEREQEGFLFEPLRKDSCETLADSGKRIDQTHT